MFSYNLFKGPFYPKNIFSLAKRTVSLFNTLPKMSFYPNKSSKAFLETMEKKYQENLLNLIIKETSDSTKSYSQIRIFGTLKELMLMEKNPLLKEENSKIRELINKLKGGLYTQEIKLYNNKLNSIEVDLLKLKTDFSLETYSSLKKAFNAIHLKEMPSKFMLARVNSLIKTLDSINEGFPNYQQNQAQSLHNQFTTTKEEGLDIKTSITLEKAHSCLKTIGKTTEKPLELKINTSTTDESCSLNTDVIALGQDCFDRRDIKPQLRYQEQDTMAEISGGNARPKSSSITSLDEGIDLDATFEYPAQADSDPESNDSDYDSASDCGADDIQFKNYSPQCFPYNEAIHLNQSNQLLLGETIYINGTPTTDL
ncbi:hypothetical protein [Candidatus Tisiphia endosymbiont of Nemotelus uliginosus]|uniref:hypothetical protein n=1 Tax=Candidatus Tisiphia endosymbiont of Nemotelus uliginosus TaxID=3077926 RepID=UPI0035C93CC7